MIQSSVVPYVKMESKVCAKESVQPLMNVH